MLILLRKFQKSTKKQFRKQNRYIDYLINLTSEAVNRLFVLSFENNTGQASYTRYYLPRVDIKDHNVMINGQNFCDQPVKNDLIIWYHSKNCNWSRKWLHNWLFTRLSLFQKLL